MLLLRCTFCSVVICNVTVVVYFLFCGHLRCYCCGVHLRCHCYGVPFVLWSFAMFTVVVYLLRCHLLRCTIATSLMWCTFCDVTVVVYILRCTFRDVIVVVYLSRCHCCGVPFTMSLLWCTFAMSPLWCTSVNRTLKANYRALSNNRMGGGEGELNFCVRGSQLLVCDVNPARVSLNPTIPTSPRSERGWPDGKHEGKEST